MLDGNPFELRNVTVKYGDKLILNNLSWTVKPHQHWWIKGENGAGKSTLLSLITGDHPQGFSNEVYLFGRKRGSGETIWEIKQNLGYVSSQLHMDYRVNCFTMVRLAPSKPCKGSSKIKIGGCFTMARAMSNRRC